MEEGEINKERINLISGNIKQLNETKSMMDEEEERKKNDDIEVKPNVV